MTDNKTADVAIYWLIITLGQFVKSNSVVRLLFAE